MSTTRNIGMNKWIKKYYNENIPFIIHFYEQDRNKESYRVERKNKNIFHYYSCRKSVPSVNHKLYNLGNLFIVIDLMVQYYDMTVTPIKIFQTPILHQPNLSDHMELTSIAEESYVPMDFVQEVSNF